MQALAEGDLHPLIRYLQQPVVGVGQLRPSRRADYTGHRRQVVRAAVGYLVLVAQGHDIVIGHLHVLLQELLVDGQALELVDELAQALVGGQLHPFAAVVQQFQHDIGELALSLVLLGKLGDLEDDVSTGFPQPPVLRVLCFLVVVRQDAVLEELLRDHLGYGGQVLDRLFLDPLAGVVAHG